MQVTQRATADATSVGTATAGAYNGAQADNSVRSIADATATGAEGQAYAEASALADLGGPNATTANLQATSSARGFGGAASSATTNVSRYGNGERSGVRGRAAARSKRVCLGWLPCGTRVLGRAATQRAAARWGLCGASPHCGLVYQTSLAPRSGACPWA